MSADGPPIALTEPTLAPPRATSPAIRRTRRQRRPSGAPPPLPRSIGTTGRGWIVVAGVLVAWVIAVLSSHSLRRVTDRADSAVLRAVAHVRTAGLTSVFDVLHHILTGRTFTVVMFAFVVALMVLKRWRHLFTFLGSLVTLEIALGVILYPVYGRARPFDVRTISAWAGFSFPAPPLAVATVTFIGIAYALVVPGRARTVAKSIATVALLVFVAGELYLATYNPFDVLFAITTSVAVMVNAFRVFTPNDVYPVTYRGGKTAHLDVTGRRGDAVKRAVQDQLGLLVVDIEPVGLAGSGGSTPLRLRVAGDPDTFLFGKLYAMSHVRADRFYKLGRTVLYGRLEDEAPFQSVRRLAMYEDYTLRLMHDAGIPSAAPYGIVELTPEREYLLVTEFFDGAREIGDAEVDDDIIDQGLMLIRHLWDAGLAHRDIKPANLMVHDGKVVLIDVAFAQVRPSPWRQAVDLANMMLVLAVRTDANRVYDRALRLFSPDEIAEAFAAARGVASPTQLRTAMKRDGRDLLAKFRSLAPARRPITLQRWNARRILLTVALLFGLLLSAVVTASLLRTGEDAEVTGTPSCTVSDLTILMAQSVPSATSVPCIATLPAGWHLGGVRVRSDRSQFWLDSDQAGDHAVDVNLRPPSQCAVTTATEVPSDEVGLRRFELPEQLPPNLRDRRYYVFPGGCVTYDFAFSGTSTAALIFDVDNALGFYRRSLLVDAVRGRNGLRLCGAGARCTT